MTSSALRLRGSLTVSEESPGSWRCLLAVENRADVVSFDSDFERFPGVRWQRPEVEAGGSSIPPPRLPSLRRAYEVPRERARGAAENGGGRISWPRDSSWPPTELVVTLYNPVSRSRSEQSALAEDVLLDIRSVTTTTTVVVVRRDVGRAGEALSVTTLGALDPASIDTS